MRGGLNQVTVSSSSLALREAVLSEMQSFPRFQADFPTSVTIGEYTL